MKKIIYKRLYLISILIATMLNLPFWGMAQSVSIQEAELVALRFANKDSKGGAKQVKKIEKVSMHGVAFLYLAHLNDGWVLLSSERAATPILAESVTGTFPVEDEMPDGMKWILSYYERANQYARDSLSVESVDAEWDIWLNDNASNRDSIRAIASEVILEPFTTIYWNQSFNNSSSDFCSKPYNYYCPTWTQPSCNHTYVGCTAVAMGMVMWYYQWPHSAIVPAYMLDSTGYTGSTMRLAKYDWNIIPSALYNTTPDNQFYAVAELLRDCGYASHMEYKFDGSEASLGDAMDAMEDMFHYETMYHRYRSWYVGNWTNKIKAEINAGRPVIYSGYNDHSGHTFIVCGYNSNNQFKINWGWGGNSNIGFYSLDALDPRECDNGPYNDGQEVLWEIRPDYPSCSSILFNSDDVSDNPFEIYGGGVVQSIGTTISSNKTGVIYAGQGIILLPPFTIQSGTNVHLAIRDMHCDLADLDNSSESFVTDTDSLGTETPTPQYLPARLPDETIVNTTLVQPNPAEDRISIQIDQIVKSIFIYDYSGRCVLQTESDDISIGHLPPGMYIVRVYTADGQTLQSKFVHK